MGKAGAGIGGSIGGLIGFIVGSIIPFEGEVAMSFLGRVTSDALMNDPTGFFISGIYMIMAVAICGTIGGFIGGIFGN